VCGDLCRGVALGCGRVYFPYGVDLFRLEAPALSAGHRAVSRCAVKVWRIEKKGGMHSRLHHTGTALRLETGRARRVWA